MKQATTNQNSSTVDQVPTSPKASDYRNTSASSPDNTSKLRSTLEVLTGLFLYLVCTGICLQLAWFIPGRGIDTILLRLLIGAWIPGVAVFASYRILKKKGQKRIVVGLLIGIGCISLAFIFGAIAIADKFRL